MALYRERPHSLYKEQQMQYAYLTLNWVFGVLFLLTGAASLFSAPLVGMLFVFISLLLLPPVKKLIYSKFNTDIPLNIKAIAITVLLFTSIFPIIQYGEDQAEMLAEQQVKQKEQESIDYFIANRDRIIASVSATLAAGNYFAALEQARNYLVSGDEELLRMESLATVEIKKAIKAQEEKQLALQQRKQQIESQFSAWNGSHRKLERLIKDYMNDPDSYKHDSTTYIEKDDHLIIETTYRGKNAFGGMVRDSVTAKVNLDGVVLEILD